MELFYFHGDAALPPVSALRLPEAVATANNHERISKVKCKKISHEFSSGTRESRSYGRRGPGDVLRSVGRPRPPDEMRAKIGEVSTHFIRLLVWVIVSRTDRDPCGYPPACARAGQPVQGT